MGANGVLDQRDDQSVAACVGLGRCLPQPSVMGLNSEMLLLFPGRLSSSAAESQVMGPGLSLAWSGWASHFPALASVFCLGE